MGLIYVPNRWQKNVSTEKLHDCDREGQSSRFVANVCYLDSSALPSGMLPVKCR